MRGPAPAPVAERFEAKVERCPMSGCWLWSDAPDRYGYGRLLVGGRAIKAHRLSYELHVGPIPAGFDVCHRCDTPPCVNPHHLWLGTHVENVADMDRKGRRDMSPRWSPRGARHPRAKLTLQYVEGVRALLSSGGFVDYAAEAKVLGVSPSTVWRALRGDTWSDGPDEEPADLGPPNLDLFDHHDRAPTG